jgi:hypothetical protein
MQSRIITTGGVARCKSEEARWSLSGACAASYPLRLEREDFCAVDLEIY